MNNGHSSNKLFSPDRSLTVQRAPIMSGLSCSGGGMSASVLKPFRRPKELRRTKEKANDVALKSSSLGMRKRLDGMARIMELSGKGLASRGPMRTADEQNSGEETSDGDEEEEEEDRPFEPLKLWQSPYQGAEPKGLPSRM